MTEARKLEEGLEYIRNAEKSLKTGLLKWRPDYDVAADEYSRAATCFQVAKSYQKCYDCLMKASDCHKQNRSWFHAAKSLEQAILICKDLGDLREIPHLAEKSASLYQQYGSPEAAATVLNKAAKLLEQNNAEEALRLYQHAADVAMIEDNNKQAAEYVSKSARILIKLKQYDQAADAIRREIGLHQQSESLQSIGRLAVALVLVQLAREDYVAAEKAFKEWGNCCDAPEVQTLEALIQAYDEEDPDAARAALNSPFIKHMDVEYARLARDLPLPKGISLPAPSSVRPNAAPSYVSPNAPVTSSGSSGQPTGSNEDDEEEGGLC
nr:PREDICTED: gamma-soluble NSF attachment protein-like [Bemisia tabaci]